MTSNSIKNIRAVRNRTILIENSETGRLKRSVAYFDLQKQFDNTRNCLICGDAFQVLPTLPEKSISLLFADPPYNLTKNFGTAKFKRTGSDVYEEWLDSWLRLCIPLLRPEASIYICGDWRSGSAIERSGSKYFKLRNRITWEREKGRGAKQNWKNAAEDIWFFTASDKYTFNLDSVKQHRRVLAPYRENGKPKDWEETTNGNFRVTHPSNLWTDISVPFWSMPENTDHPTQKPEKLLAKLILASTDPGETVLDPFAGSGTTAVVAKKLEREFIAIESNEDYCLLGAKRLAMAENYSDIQGFEDGVFWERNTQRSRMR